MSKTRRKYRKIIQKTWDKWWQECPIARKHKHPEKYTGYLYEDDNGKIAHKRFRKWLHRAERRVNKMLTKAPE
jgi:hypothetical protein